MTVVTSISAPSAIPATAIGRDSGEAERRRAALLRGADPAAEIGRLFALEPFHDLDIEYEPQERILWCHFRFGGRPCFSEGVLHDFQRVRELLHRAFDLAGSGEAPVRFVVLGSRMPGVWNLGGDLNLFANLIRTRDRERLLRYALMAAESGYRYTTSFDLPLTTVSLVQGDALGGGFEAALSSNLLIAERSAKFGLPEILFNLFPGMGAYSFLARRIAPGLAERMILSGTIYSAEELHAMGVVDILAEDGSAVSTLYDLVGQGEARNATHRALHRIRRIVQPVTLDEMHEIARIWVDRALDLGEGDLRRMSRLVSAQDRRRARMPAG